MRDTFVRTLRGLAEKHSRQMQGMDHRKVVLGIKQRIAKERGFAL